MLKEYLTSIANAIRSKLGSTAKINAQDFPAKIDEVFNEGYLRGIPYGYNRGKEEGKLELLQDSEYMNAKVNGTAIAVNDVNAVEHSVGCRLSGKNLLNYTIPKGIINNIYLPLDLPIGTYTFSAKIKAEFTENAYALFQRKNKNEESYKIFIRPIDAQTYKPMSFDIEPNYDYRLYLFCDAADYMYNTFEGFQIEKGTTATEYTPYIADVGGVEVSRYGKNLLSPDIGDLANWSDVSGTTAGAKVYDLNLPIGTYTFSCELAETDNNYWGYLYLQKSNDNWATEQSVHIIQGRPVKMPCKFYIKEGEAYRFWWWSGETKTLDLYSNFQIETGATATPYEPYVEPVTYTAKADGTVEGVISISPNMTLLTNNNGVVINANYLRDIDTYIDNLKTNVALTGGE